jgi:drug/metabolite transporter (DMT)-like permease
MYVACVGFGTSSWAPQQRAYLFLAVWVLLYGVAGNLIYGIEESPLCPVGAFITAAAILLVFAVLLYLRRRPGHSAKTAPVFALEPVSYMNGGIGKKAVFQVVLEDEVPPAQLQVRA